VNARALRKCVTKAESMYGCLSKLLRQQPWITLTAPNVRTFVIIPYIHLCGEYRDVTGGMNMATTVL